MLVQPETKSETHERHDSIIPVEEERHDPTTTTNNIPVVEFNHDDSNV